MALECAMLCHRQANGRIQNLGKILHKLNQGRKPAAVLRLMFSIGAAFSRGQRTSQNSFGRGVDGARALIFPPRLLAVGVKRDLHG